MNWWKKFWRIQRMPSYFYDLKCSCGRGKILFWVTDYVAVNCHSDGKYRDDIIHLQVRRGCDNPLCEWSKIEVEE